LTPDEAFDAAFAVTVGGIEGGYSLIPDDPGGETYRGVARREHPDWPGWALVDAAKARPNFPASLDSDTAVQAALRSFYRGTFWGAMDLDAVAALSPNIAGKLFDIGVNCGQDISARFLQRALNAFNHRGADYADVIQDGNLGPRTVEALGAYLAKRAGQGGAKVLHEALSCQQGTRYLELGERNPKLEDFEFGWFRNRVLL